MYKLPTRLFLLITPLILLSSFLFFYTDVSSYLGIFSKKSNDTKNTPSAFSSLVKEQPRKTTDALNTVFAESAGQLKSEPEGDYIFWLGVNVINFEHDTDWDYTQKPFWAHILGSSKDLSTLNIKFISPTTMPYLDEEKEVKVVGCAPYNSFLTTESPRSSQVNTDFFESIKDGDDVISFCLNEGCTEIGRLCKLYRY